VNDVDRGNQRSAAPERREVLKAGLTAVRHRIARACESAGRGADEVTLIVVTKTFPASDVAALAELGVRDVGENRDQEAAPKHDAVNASDLRWHCIGRIQTNKARSIATWADAVHSIDRARVATALGAAADAGGRTLDSLIQVSLDGDPARGGAIADDVPALADLVASTAGLALAGVMAVAPLDIDPAAAFERLREVSAALRDDHPQATWISAGMSQDLEAAVGAGATHVRVGSAVLGARPPVR
jgi:pyridoxal phosphate enzyme (YggS family)